MSTRLYGYVFFYDKKLEYIEKEMSEETLFTAELCNVKLNMAKTHIFS